MGSANKTKALQLPQWLGNEYFERLDMNGAFSNIEKAVATFDYLSSTYGYTWTQTDSEETGATTIVVTLGSTSPVTGTLTAVISENEQGETVIDVTTVLDGVTTNYTHTLSDEGGEGGPDNG